MRRTWIIPGALALAGVAATGPVDARQTLVYIGTQASAPGEGIVAARLDDRTGRLTAIGLAVEVRRPLWLLHAPGRPVVWSVSEAGTPDGPPAGRVHAFAIDRRTGQLRMQSEVATGGRGPTHLAFDDLSGTLFVAHYGTGQVAAIPVGADGTLSAPTALVQDIGTGPTKRQTGPHAHAAVLDPTGRFVLVPDLGADRVFIYRFDRQQRTLAPAATPYLALPPGSGPRHLVFGHDGLHAYLITELDVAVTVLGWNAQTGTLSEQSRAALAAAPAGASPSASEIAISPDGRTLYAGNRGSSTIEVFAVDPRTGALTRKQSVASGGKLPWHFAIDPSGRWLVVSNQGSNELAVLGIARRTGLLSAPVSTLSVSKPVAVVFD